MEFPGNSPSKYASHLRQNKHLVSIKFAAATTTNSTIVTSCHKL